MVALLVFSFVLLVIAAAVGVPVLAWREGRVDDADAAVLGGVVLTLGLGGLNLAFVLGNVVFGDFGAKAVVLGLAPMAAGALGLWVVRRGKRDGRRTPALVAAALLTVAGLPGYFALPVAVVTSAAAAGFYLAGLTSPRKLLARLDPRE